MKKFYFYSWFYYNKHDESHIYGGVTDEHPFKLLKLSDGAELISFQEITKDEYDLWHELDLK